MSDPLIVHWPNGISARGEVRGQYVHVVDVAPTILEALGLEAPATLNGMAQRPLEGVSVAPTFNDADAQDGAVLRDDRLPRLMGGRLEGRGGATAGRAVDRGDACRAKMGALSRRARFLGVRGPCRASSRKALEARRAMVGGGGEVQRPAARLAHAAAHRRAQA